MTEPAPSPKPLPGHTQRMVELWEQRTRPEAPAKPRRPRPPSISSDSIFCLCSCHFEPMNAHRRLHRDWPMRAPSPTPPPAPPIRVDPVPGQLAQPPKKAAQQLLSKIPTPRRVWKRPPLPFTEPVADLRRRVD